MKSYYLRFKSSDFIKAGNIWRTPTYDLYSNVQYKNYSVKQSQYGTNLLGDGTYTGLNKLSATSSEIGFVSGGRFIDTSGRIDILNWNLNFIDDPTAEVATNLSVYTADAANATPYYAHATPSLVSDWVYRQDLDPGTPIYFIDANRYVFFELNFSTELASVANLNIELIISIEIDPPVINGYFEATRKLQDKFPEWMDIREYDPTDTTGLANATPSSIGGKVLNAVAGEWLSDIRGKAQYQQFQQYIDTVDLGQPAWAFRTSGVPNVIRNVMGNGVVLAAASDINEFYTAAGSATPGDVFLWNKFTNEIYTIKKYNNFYINYDASATASTYTYTQEAYRTWNSVDDIGVNVDLYRIQSATPNGYLETNDSFRKRILDVYRNPPSITSGGFKNALRRELNLWRYSGATPNSDYLGATPTVLEMADLENDPNYFNLDGMPTQKFKDLVEELANKYPMTWGYFKYGKAFWDSDGIQRDGFTTLPRRLDATPIAEQYLDSGVGDGNDMYLFKPKPFTGAVTFNTNLKIRGRQRTTRTEYPPLTFDVKVYGKAAESLYVNPQVSAKFTIELSVLNTAATPSSPSSTIYYAIVDLADTNNQNFYAATPTGVLFDWTTLDGYTSSLVRFNDRQTGQYVGQVNLNNVYRVDIKPGAYNGNQATPAYDNVPTQAYYKAWFTSTPGTVMGLGGGTVLTRAPYNWTTTDASFYFQSQRVQFTGATPGNWVSDAFNYTIKLNGGTPLQTQNYQLDIPQIVFPASTSSRQIIVELVTRQGSTYGTYADVTSATPIFLPATYIAVNGDATWTSGQKIFATSTTSIIFSSGSGTAYPVVGSNVWSLFSSTTPYTVSGTVDENGPYRYSQKAQIGNANYNLTTLNLTRDNFGIPNTSDYIITWIGVDTVSSSNVISWLDTNTIVPAVTDPGETQIYYTYPDSAITESFNSSTGKYEFNGINVYAKIKPGVNKEWNPKAHSGWFHDDIDEYYMYANAGSVSATGSYVILPDLNRQGAPLIVNGIAGGTPVSMRQVALFADSATPQLGFTNTQILYGNGTKNLYTAYRNIYNVTAFDQNAGATVTLSSTASTDNIVRFVNPTVVGHTYTITYTPALSFYADNDYQDSTPSYKTRVVFDKSAPQNNFTSYTVNYETSVYDPATPINMPLNGLYTSISEGFVFIDHDIRPLNQVEVKVSPSKITADGLDYALVTITSLDNQGNPKPNQTFTLFSNFGNFNNSTITTDRDGFGSAILTSTSWNGATPITPATPVVSQATPGGSIQGQLLVHGAVDTKLGFGIQIPPQPQYNIIAVLDSDFILSDGRSATSIFGLVENSNHQPLPYGTVYWRKARTINELFTKVGWNTSQATPGNANTSGLVYADANGRFSIGPFLSGTSPGYWIASVETGSASPNTAANQFNLTGDVVYWYEHPDVTSSIDPITQLPFGSVQEATPSWSIPMYSTTNVFPATYDETVLQAGRTSATPVFLPPKWWAINKNKQYQMGLYGTKYDTVGATPSFPEYKDY